MSTNPATYPEHERLVHLLAVGLAIVEGHTMGVVASERDPYRPAPNTRQMAVQMLEAYPTLPDTSDERLYGWPGDETLETDPDELLEMYDGEPDALAADIANGRTIIEEFSVVPPIKHLPDIDRLLEWVVEWSADMGEVDDYYPDHLETVCDAPDVRAAAGRLLRTMAAGIKYRMADRRTGTWTVSVDDNGRAQVTRDA